MNDPTKALGVGITFPLVFEYDSHDTRGSYAEIRDASGVLIADTTTSEAWWQDLEVLVKLANHGWKMVQEELEVVERGG